MFDLATVSWRWCRFDELSVFELDAMYRVRQQVFSVEQECAYLDADGFDRFSFHLTASSGGPDDPIAYARVVQPGQKYDEASIGRDITSMRARGKGLGRELVARAIRHCVEAYPASAIRISAQSRLESFYKSFGFVIVGEQYLEDGLPHTEMLRLP